jgi:long-chain fatty acid transport protein
MMTRKSGLKAWPVLKQKEVSSAFRLLQKIPQGGVRMKKLLLAVLVSVFVLSAYGLSFATNGDNLIAIGPIARAMGGVGIAAPQDAISAVFSNPAAMCFGPYCPGSEVNFAGSVFMPDAHAQIVIPGPLDVGKQKSDSDLFLIPAIGISSPITPDLRFGIAAYGVSGLGVDYRDNPANSPFHTYTNFQSMKFAPNIAYMVSPNFSVGLAVQIDYGALDLAEGTSTGYTVGAQLGAIYKTGPLSLGAVYVTPQEIKYDNVSTFGTGTLHSLKLTSPQSAGIGIGYEPIQNVLLVELDGRWINWGDAKGYEDFNWKDQWVAALGVQYKATPKLSLRAGVNYGNNPVKTDTLTAGTFKSVQGVTFPQFNYEAFRLTGFPAVVETHATVGLGYQIAKKVSVNLGYMHAFKKTMHESGTADLYDPNTGALVASGVPASIETDLSEDSIDFGITWQF